MSQTISETYADFADGLQFSDLPEALVEKAKLHILDTVGCALAATNSEFATSAFSALQRLEGGSGSVAFGRPETLGLRDAILFNGGIANALDFDDTYTPTLNHISGGAVPLILGLGAREDATGPDILTAYLIAMEIGTHVGLGVPGNAIMRRGFVPSGTFDVFANALAAAKVLGLDREQMIAAQGAALTLMSGAMEGLKEGALSKRLNAGLGAMNGLTAAMMAASDMTGPRRPYEGDTGLYTMLLGPDTEVDWPAMTNGLGKKWEFEAVAIKAFPMVHHAHNVVECAIRMHQEDGVRPEDIERMTALVTEHQVKLICEPEDVRRHPPNEHAGVFSVYHMVAVGLAKGSLTLADCGPENLADPTISALRDRVDYEIDTKSLFPVHFSGGLRATLRDGRVIDYYEPYHRGSLDRPMPAETVIEKFRANAEAVYDTDRVTAIINEVERLDGRATPASVLALLGAP